MHYYFDMDGVLAVYEPENPPGTKPWLDVESHFYRTREPHDAWDGPRIHGEMQLETALRALEELRVGGDETCAGAT